MSTCQKPHLPTTSAGSAVSTRALSSVAPLPRRSRPAAFESRLTSGCCLYLHHLHLPLLVAALALLGPLALCGGALAQEVDAAAESTTSLWASRPIDVIDQTVEYRVALEPSPDKGDDAVVGTYEVRSTMPVPLSNWIDQYCDGNDKLEQVVTYQVTGTRTGSALALTYRSPKSTHCTCPVKCRVRDKGGKVDALISADGQRLQWGDALLFAADALEADATQTAGAYSVAGSWVWGPGQELDMTVKRLLELSYADAPVGDETGDPSASAERKLSGTYTVDITRPLPLDSWRDRFCDGSEEWKTVQTWKVEGTVTKGQMSVRYYQGRLLACSCPSKCKTDERGATLRLRMGPGGETLVDGSAAFRRQPVP